MVEKQGQKIRAGVSPPPLFGQCPKENIFFFVRASLTVLAISLGIAIILIYFRLLDDTDRDVRAAGGAEVEPPLKLKENKLEAEISTA